MGRPAAAKRLRLQWLAGASRRAAALAAGWLAFGGWLPLAAAGDSCCAKAAAAVGGAPPVEWIPDPDAVQPETWDEEEDGPWERPLIQKPRPGPLAVFRAEMVNSLRDACPWLLLGLLFTGALQAAAPSPEAMQRRLAGRGPLVVAKGAALGLASPLCSCGVLPIAVGLAGAGASSRAIVAFIVAAQSAGVDSLLFTVGVLGPAAAATRLAAAGVLGAVVGLAAPAGVPRAAPPACRRGAPAAASWPARAWAGVAEAVTDTFDEVAPPVLFGFAATALVVALMPEGGLGATAGLGGLGGRAAVLAVSLPLQFCEHAAVPMAAALQKAGASGGLAFAVLSTMPSINAASLGVISVFAGASGAARVAAALWLSGLVGSLAADRAGLGVVQVGHGGASLPEWYQRASVWAVAAVAAGAVLRLARRRLRPAAAAAAGRGACCKAD